MKVKQFIENLLEYNQDAEVRIGIATGSGDMDYEMNQFLMSYTSDDLTKENADTVVILNETHKYETEAVKNCTCDDCTCK